MMVTVRPYGLRIPRGAGKATGAAIEAGVKAITRYLREDATGTLSQQIEAATKAAAARPGATPTDADATPTGYLREGAGNAAAGRAVERWWRRGGVGTVLEGAVDPAALDAVLVGRDPVSGVDLMGRSGGRAAAADLPQADVVMTVQEAAAVLDVTPRRVRQMAEAGQDPSKRQENRSWLAGRKDEQGRWVFAASDVEDARRRRDGTSLTLGIEVTFSAPKSVSLLWAAGDEATRAAVEEAWDAAVAAGLDYLCDRGLQISVGRGPHRQYRRADGVYVAGFRHGSNRYGEPQLHEHTVVANMGDAGLEDGRARALDMRGIWTHATTSGYLAGATLRHQLSESLRVVWDEPDGGLSDIAGVSQEIINRFSSRRRDIMQLVDAAGLSDSIAAREVASLATRPDKDLTETLDEMLARWSRELDDAGFNVAALATNGTVAAPDEDEIAALFQRLLSTEAGGLVHFAPTFDRRDVIQAIAQWANERLDAQGILDLTDRFLGQAPIVALQIAPAGKLPPRGGAAFTVESLLADGDYIARRYAAGASGRGALELEAIEAAIAAAGDTGMLLGDDQAEMVRSICGSGLDVQAVLGPAGAGKTVALGVAAAAWRGAGLTVTGAAVGGTAADVLGRSAGVDSRTVASLLAHLERGEWLAGDVLLLDEAATLGDRAHARILRAAQEHGAIIRTVGDPRQHGSVEAGGMWARVAAESPHTAELTENRRQAGDTMADVRAAVRLIREDTPQALRQGIEILEEAERIVSAADPDEALDHIVDAWWAEREGLHRDGQAGQHPSEMIAEHHDQRRELSLRAQALLRDAGVLKGPGLATDDGVFFAGDHVVCRKAWRTRNTAGQWARIRNGDHGTVRGIRWDLTGGPGVIVDWGSRKGTTILTQAELNAPLRPGVAGILATAYARTSHAAQGSTYRAARMVIDTRTTRAGLYVGATRGSHDLSFYTLDVEALADAEDDDPYLRSYDTRLRLPATQAIIEQLVGERTPVVPAADDPAALRVARAAGGEVAMEELSADDAGRALRMRRRLRDGAAIHGRSLPGAVAAALGPRPGAGGERAAWDSAVRAGLDVIDRALETGHERLDDLAGLLEGDTTWQSALAQLAVQRLASETPAWRMRVAADSADPRLTAAMPRADSLDVWRAINDPAEHLTAALGPMPGTTAPEERQRWLDRAEAIETWRRIHCRLDSGEGDLLPALEGGGDAAARRAYAAAKDAIENRLGDERPERDVPLLASAPAGGESNQRAAGANVPRLGLNV